MNGRLKKILQRDGDETVYDRIVRVCLWLTVFMVPWFFLPFSTEPLEMNKAMLFYVLVLVAAFAWLLKFILVRKGTFVRTAVDMPLALLVLFSLGAALFSVYRYRSFAGVSGYVVDSFTSTVFFVLFFLLLVNVMKKDRTQQMLAAVFLSGALLLVFNFFQVFGTYLLPWDFSKTVGFTALANSPATFSFFAAFIGLMSFFRFVRKHVQEEKTDRDYLYRTLHALLAVLSLFLLLVYDQTIGWVMLILGLVIMMAMNARSKLHETLLFIVPSLTIGIAVLALFMNTQSWFQANIPADIQLPQRTSVSIAVESVKARPFFGYGQTMFDAAFATSRPVELNTSPLWSLRFLKSGSQVLQLLTTTGALTTLAFLAVAALALLYQLRAVLRVSHDDHWWWHRVAVFIATSLVTVLLFLMPFNMALMMLFWLSLGMGFVVNGEVVAGVQRQNAQKSNAPFIATLGFSVAVVLGVMFLYFAGRLWTADIATASASRLINEQGDLAKVQQKLSNAVSWNPYEQTNYLDLAQNLLVQAQLEAQQETPDTAKVTTLLSASVAAAKSALQKFPRSVSAQESVATIYASIDSMTGTTSPETLAAYQQARDLEPNNPQLTLALGQYHLSVAQQIAQQEVPDDDEAAARQQQQASDALTAALTAFEHALQLKPGYVDADLNAALTLRLQGKGSDAVQKLEALTSANPANTDVLFNLGENYLIDGRDDDAASIYLRVVSLFPGHSNAHFRLAQIYEQDDETQKAIAEYEIVAALNPDSATVKEKIAELKGS